MKLIDKDALVAELKNRIRDYWNDTENPMGIYPYTLEEVIKYVDTLEVKELDLEKVFNDEYSKFSNDVDAMDYSFPIDLADYKYFAKHFFELGVKIFHPI